MLEEKFITARLDRLYINQDEVFLQQFSVYNHIVPPFVNGFRVSDHAPICSSLAPLRRVPAPPPLPGWAFAHPDFRELYPEQTSLINDLQGDIFKVAGDAGMTKHMNNHRNNFGNGWSRSLDHSIESVRRAIDVVIAGQSPEGGNDYEAKGE